MDRFYHYGKEVPPSRSIWSYSLRLTRSSTLYFVYKLFLHFLPALIVDSAMIVARAKPRYGKFPLILDELESFISD